MFPIINAPLIEINFEIYQKYYLTLQVNNYSKKVSTNKIVEIYQTSIYCFK
jgi:hypothetical protein